MTCPRSVSSARTVNHFPTQCFHLGTPARRESLTSWRLIAGNCTWWGSLLQRVGSAQHTGEERGGPGRAGCSPQFLSSRPLGQSLTPSQVGTQSPFTEQRNSPGQAGGGRAPLGCVIMTTPVDAAPVCYTGTYTPEHTPVHMVPVDVHV